MDLFSLDDIENLHKQDEKNLASKGNSIVYVVQDEKIMALIGVNDIIRNEAKDSIKDLLSMEIETVMLLLFLIFHKLVFLFYQIQ